MSQCLQMLRSVNMYICHGLPKDPSAAQLDDNNLALLFVRHKQIAGGIVA